METSFKARQMVPGKDTLSTMAMHYGISNTTIMEVVRDADADVIRADGFHGFLGMVDTKVTLAGQPRNRNRKVLGWSDGQVGVDPSTTKLTRKAIRAVASWKWKQDSTENDEDK